MMGLTWVELGEGNSVRTRRGSKGGRERGSGRIGLSFECRWWKLTVVLYEVG